MEDKNPTPMDPKLAEAACSGNVDLLRETVAAAAAAAAAASCQEINNGELDYSSSCFLSQHEPSGPFEYERKVGNIFHLSAKNDREEFFREAMLSLPDPLVHLLLSQSDIFGKNPLHVAAEEGYLGIVKLILGFYVPKSDQKVDDSETKLAPKPWLALDSNGWTPLHLALDFGKEECGLEILMFVDNHDMEALCNMINEFGDSPLLLAVRRGCNRVAMQILTSAPSYSLSGSNGHTPLHFVTASSGRDLHRISGNHTSRVGLLSAKEINELYSTLQFPEILDEQKVPTVEDALTFVSSSVRRIILDAKTGPPSYEKGLAENILAVVQRTHCANCLVWAKSDTLVRDIIKLSPNTLVGYIVMRDPSSGVRSNLLRINRAQTVGIYHPLIDENAVQLLRRRNKKIYAWTVDDLVSMRDMLLKRVDAVVTNKPTVLQQLMQDTRVKCLEDGFSLPR